MQKTRTINGRRYTGKQIISLFDGNNMTKGGDYTIRVDGMKFYANYRVESEGRYYPVSCSEHATAIKLESASDDCKTVWLSL